VAIFRKTLFENENMQIGLFKADPISDACGEVEWQSLNAIVLAINGVFSKHDRPGQHVIGTPSHAVFFAANAPYRIGFPGAVGDRAITLRFGEELAPERLTRGDGEILKSQGLLPAEAMMLRNLLWRRLERNEADEFEAEALGFDLLNMALKSVRTGEPAKRPSAEALRRRALERVKEAVAVAPSRRWNVAKLAEIAHLSPFHLCHVFRDTVGTSIYDYVLHERLARTLDAVLDCEGDLTTIALDAGFASHSHLTLRFRSFFGCTPAALRRMATAAHIAELRKIVTARPH
jgi:AraC family transcriptional regulator